MHDMTAKPAAVSRDGHSLENQKNHRRFPTTAWMRKQAPRNVPLFAYEYGDTGAGNDVGIAHNWAAFDAIKMVPRYGVMPSLPPTEVELFGTRYAAPIGIAPMGGPSLVAGRRSVDGEGGATRARSLHARRGRRRHHRGRRESRARCVLAAALSFRARRSQNRFRADRARAGGQRQGAGAHPRRAGAHHALARDLCRAGRRIPPEPAHDLRNDDPAEMAAGAVAQRLSALCHHPLLCRRARQHQ